MFIKKIRPFRAKLLKLLHIAIYSGDVIMNSTNEDIPTVIDIFK